MSTRLNATLTNLKTALPGYFNIKHKQSVPFTDSRIVLNGDKYASSLLLSFIDIWMDLGARSEAELKDNDWIFIFEDDVNIVSMDVIQRFYPEIHAKWKYSNPNSSIAGSKRLFRMKIFECTQTDWPKTSVNSFSELIITLPIRSCPFIREGKLSGREFHALHEYQYSIHPRLHIEK
jgi:hypothetical protein